MKYILSIILSFVSVASLADDNITLYYEANGQCSGLYSVVPTSGCYTGGVQVSNITNQDTNSGYYVDGVQIIDANGNVNPDAADILAGNGPRNQTAVTDTETDPIYGPWNVYFYGGDNSNTPLFTRQYRRNPKWNAGSGNATYIGVRKYVTGISNGLVHGWCTDPNLDSSTCVTDAQGCTSGCDDLIRIILPWNESGNKSYYAWLDCDRGYHQDGHKCVKDATTQIQTISQAECQVTNGIWDGQNCKYRIYWLGPQCSSNSQNDSYYIAGRENNIVHCGMNGYRYGYKFMGWCLESGANAACTNDVSGSVKIPANARGDITFWAHLYCYGGRTYNAATGRCSETATNNDYESNPPYICDNSNLWGCNTESSCNNRGGVYDADNNMCASQSFVTSNDNSMWPTHYCNTDNTCVGVTQSEQERCQNDGGTWLANDNKCEYSITWVYNIGAISGNKPICQSSYIAGEETTITCLPDRTASYFQSWCADNTLLSSCTKNSDGTVKIPATARGRKMFYAKWKCRKGTWETGHLCLSVSSSNADYHCAQYPNSSGCETTFDYKCIAGTDLSGCRSATECASANGTWDNLNGMCAWNPKLENSSLLRTMKYYCGSHTYSAGTVAATVTNIKPDAWLNLEDVFDYCSIPGDTPNFVGWQAKYLSPIKGTGGGHVSPTTTWDNNSYIQFPIAENAVLNMVAQWRAGSNGKCPDNVKRYLLSLADYEINGSAQRNGKMQNCPYSGCGEDWYNANVGNLANCTMTWNDTYHRQFVEWCKDAEWTQCGVPLTFGPTYYAKYSCTDGYSMDHFKLCRCQGTMKPIDYRFENESEVVGWLPGAPGSPMRHKCWNYQCDNEEIPSSWCRPKYAAETHKYFAGWCRDAARTDCPVTGGVLTDTFLLEGNRTYYDSWKCADGYVKSGNSCVPE